MKVFLILFALVAVAAAFPAEVAEPTHKGISHHVNQRDVLIPSPILRSGYGYGYGYPYNYEPYNYLRSYGYPYTYGSYGSYVV